MALEPPTDAAPDREDPISDAGKESPNDMPARTWDEPGESFTYSWGCEHQAQALPLHLTVVIILGILALVSVAGGIVAIVWNSMSNTGFRLFGAKFTTGHVGVAFVGIGLLTILFAVRSVLNNQYKLAALPPDEAHKVEKPRQRRKK